MRIFVYLSCILLLAGCQEIWQPGFMPTGYAYHNQSRAAVPGPKAPFVGYEYQETRNDGYVKIWQVVVRDLINQLEAKTGIYPQTVYVPPLRDNNAFTNSYDYALREELRQRGYVLERNPATALHMVYDAYLPLDEAEETLPMLEAKDLELNDPALELVPFILVLSAEMRGFVQQQVSGVYKLPAFGYDADVDDSETADLVLGRPR